MKILKQPDTNWSHKHTCSKCDAELEVEKTDVKYVYCSGYGREPDYDYWTATCPVCSESFHVPVTKIPKAVQVEIKKAAPKDNGPYGGGGYFDR